MTNLERHTGPTEIESPGAEDVAFIRANVDAVSGLSDEDIARLWGIFSGECYFAGWMPVDDFTDQFAYWLKEEV